MQAIQKLLYIFVITTILLLLHSAVTFASALDKYSGNTEEELIDYVEVLSSDSEETPTNIIRELDSLIELSQKSDWQIAFLHASTLKVERLASINEFVEAEKLLEVLKPDAKSSEIPILIARLDLAHLRILEKDGVSSQLYSQYRLLLDQAITLDNKRMAASIYLAVGRAQSRLSDYANALPILTKAFHIAETLDDTPFLNTVMNAIGNVNVRMKNFEEGIKYYKRSLKNSEREGATYMQIVTLYNIGTAYVGNEDFIAARKVFIQGLNLCIEIDDMKSAAWMNRGLGSLAISEKNWSQAIGYFSEVLPVFDKSTNKQASFNIINGLITAYLALQDVNNAEALLVRSRKLLPSFPDTENKTRVNTLEARLAVLNDNYKQAYERLSENIDLITDKHQQDIQKQVNLLRMQLDVETQESENKRLLHKSTLQDLLIQQQQEQQTLWRFIIALSLILFLIVCYILIRQIRLRNMFKAMAHRDHLTNSPNRRSVLSFAKRAFKRAQKSKQEVSFGILDLDKFKNVNDTYGHDVGDAVLVAFAQACEMSMRPQDAFGRYGGEEWLLVINNPGVQGAQMVLERIKKAFTDITIKGLPSPHNISFSAGIEQFNGASKKTLEQLINSADAKLYKAKAEGRDKFVF